MNAVTANDRQVAGTHYQAPYQHWDLVADTEMGYFEAQVTKYAIRHSKKNGLQDLEKALHFLDKYAEVLGDALLVRKKPSSYLLARVYKYAHANEHLGTRELAVVRLLACSHDKGTLNTVHDIISDLMGQYPGPGYVKQD
jgi:hypothetical protein